MVLTFVLASCSGSDNNSGGSTPVSGKPVAPNVTANATSEGTISIEWEKVAGVESYDLYMDSQPNVSKVNSGNATYMQHKNINPPMIHRGLVIGKTYYFVVLAKNSAGDESEFSTETSALAREFPPPASVIARNDGDSSISISWDKVIGAKSYNLYMSQDSGVSKNGVNLIDGTTKLTDFMVHRNASNPYPHNGLSNNQPYYFTVETVYPDNIVSRLSSEDTATPRPSSPIAPDNLAVGVAGSEMIPLSWADNSNNENGFRLERLEILTDGSKTQWQTIAAGIGANITQFNDINIGATVNITPGATYQYQVFAFNSIGDSLASNSITVKTPPQDSRRLLTFSNTSAAKFNETDITATAYYAAIDPNNKKINLGAWKLANDFGTGNDPEADIPAVYLNDADLGFGRRMYMITHTDGSVASYVENYASLDNAISQTNILATVAMEFAPPTYKTPIDEQLATSRQVVLAENTDNILANAHAVYRLPASPAPAVFTIYAGRKNQQSLGPFTLNITIDIKDSLNNLISSTTETRRGEWITPSTNFDIKGPSNPSFQLSVDNSATVNAVTMVTLDIAADLTSKVEMYNKAGVYVSKSTPAEARIETYLPSGTYTAVAATKLPGAIGAFELSVKIGNNAPLLMPGNWTNSGGATPHSNANVSLTFTVPASATSQMVSLSLSATEPTTIAPALYLLGDIGDYRHVEAINDEMADAVSTPAYASITQTLNAGRYWVTPDLSRTIAPGYTGGYSLEIINNTNTSTLYTGTGSWNNSVSTGPFPPNTRQVRFTVSPSSASVTIHVRHLDNTPVTPARPNAMVYLLDSTNTNVLGSNDSVFINKSYIEMDLLPGDYQIVAASDDRNQAAKFNLDVTINGDAVQQYLGRWTNSEEENPYSPSNPRFPLTLTQSSHVKIILSSVLDTSLFIIGRGDRKFTKFYTFGADGTRLGKVDLDGRNDKQQPGVCHICHGGEPKTPDAGIYPDNGDTGASFIAWDPDLYKYSDQSPYTRAEQEQKFRAFNRTVLKIRNVPHFDKQTSARTELIEGWYANSNGQSVTFNGDFVPLKWRPESTGGLIGVPDGADTLYLKVIKPTCRLCHLQRGISGESPINFGSYTNFMAFQQEIESTIYDAGTMPLALRTFNKFWQSGQGNLLASHLPGFSHYQINTTQVLKPGRPIANAGASPRIGNRIVEFSPTATPPLTAKLDGSSSLFSKNYRWVLESINGSPPAFGTNINLSGADTMVATFEPQGADQYTFRLTVDNGDLNAPLSSNSTITVQARQNPTRISFSSNIAVKLDPASGQFLRIGAPLAECAGCHSFFFKEWGKYGRFTKDQFLHNKIIDLTSPNMYSQLLNLIDLTDPAKSHLISYPSSAKHSTGVITGYGQLPNPMVPSNFELYDTMEQWIFEGAQK